jgi:hypothetical protein
LSNISIISGFLFCISSNIHYDIIEDWVVPSDLGAQTLTYGGDAASCTAQEKTRVTAENTASQINITVNQISANSITVSWSGIPEDEDWNAALSKSTVSSGRIAASVGGIIATIKGGNAAVPSAHTSYSLYVTPISGAIHLPVPEDRNRASLVLPFVSSSGTQKIDLLDPGISLWLSILITNLCLSHSTDTLYRVSLTSDDTKRKSPPPTKSAEDNNRPLFTWSSSILRHSKSHLESKSDGTKAIANSDDIALEKAIMVSTIGRSMTAHTFTME